MDSTFPASPPSYDEALAEGTRSSSKSYGRAPSSSALNNASLAPGPSSNRLIASPDWSPGPGDASLLEIPRKNFGDSVKTRFSRSPGNPLEPPPPSLSRPPPPRSASTTYSPFEPFYLPGKGEFVGDGFIPVYPGRVMVDHNISAADWERFLEDIVVAAELTGSQLFIGEVVVPLVLSPLHLGLGADFITEEITGDMQERKVPLAVALIESYQRALFQPRGVDV
jgi:hypothetical protein